MAVATCKRDSRSWQTDGEDTSRHLFTCSSSVTICSGLYFLIGIPASLQSEFSLTPAGTKIPCQITKISRKASWSNQLDLKRNLLILSARILDSRVEGGIPRTMAAPSGPDTLP